MGKTGRYDRPEVSKGSGFRQNEKSQGLCLGFFSFFLCNYVSFWSALAVALIDELATLASFVTFTHGRIDFRRAKIIASIGSV